MLLRKSSPLHRLGPTPRLNPSSEWAANLAGLWVPQPYGFVDLSPYQNHALTKTGTPQALAGHGPTGKQYHQFTGSEYWITETGRTPAGTTAFALAMWIKFAATPVTYGMVISREAGGGLPWSMYTDVQQRRLSIYAEPYSVICTDTVPADEWHLWMYTVSADGSDYAFYIDGVYNTTGSNYGPSFTIGDGPIRINARADGYIGNHALGPIGYWVGRSFTAANAMAFYRTQASLYERGSVPIPFGIAEALPSLSAATAKNITSVGFIPSVTAS